MKINKKTFKIKMINSGAVKFFCLTALMMFSVGCTTLSPISGGVKQSDGTFLLDSDAVEVAISRGGAGKKFGCMGVAIRNISDSSVEVDYTQSIITTDTGEELKALTPEQVHTLAPKYTNAEKIAQTAIVKSVIQPNESIKGDLFFSTPTNSYEIISFQFNGMPGSPSVSMEK